MAEDSSVLDLNLNIIGDKQAYNKLQAIDRLMEQVRRRRDILNRIRSNPVLNLEDRVSAPLRTIQNSLNRLSFQKVRITGEINFISDDVSSYMKEWFDSSDRNKLFEVGEKIGNELFNGIKLTVAEGMDGLFQTDKGTTANDDVKTGSKGTEKKESIFKEIAHNVVVGVATDLISDKIKKTLTFGYGEIKAGYQLAREVGYGPVRAISKGVSLISETAPPGMTRRMFQRFGDVKAGYQLAREAGHGRGGSLFNAINLIGETTPGKAGRLFQSARIAGRAAAPIALAAELYNIFKAEDKVKASKEAAGGLAGGFLGAKTGAAIGTVLFPGVGTAIGGALGGVFGYLGGKFLAKTITEPSKETTLRDDLRKSEPLESVSAPMDKLETISPGFNEDLQNIATDVIAKMGGWAEQAWNITAISTAFAFNLQNLANNVITTGTNLSNALENLKSRVSYLAESNLGFNFQSFVSGLSEGNVSNLVLAGTNGQNLHISVAGVSVNINREINEDELARRIGWEILNRFKPHTENIA